LLVAGALFRDYGIDQPLGEVKDVDGGVVGPANILG